MPTDHEHVGERLKRLRLERGLSQRELAVPGVSYAYISRIEAGTRQPSVKALRKLARQLDVSTEYLETGRDIGDGDERELSIVDAELALRLGDPVSAEARLRELFEAAVQAGDRPHAARARIALALAAFERGEHAETIAGFEEAFALERPSPLERLDVFATLGRAYGALGETEREIELYRRCLDDVSELAPENAAARTRYRILLSYALSDAGALGRAEEVVREALREAPQDGDPYMRIRLFWSLARLSEMEGHSSRALRYARRAIALLEATEDDVHCGRAYVLAAWIMNSAGDGEGAGAQLDRAEQLLGHGGSVDDIAILNVERARAAALLGNGRRGDPDRAQRARTRCGSVRRRSRDCALGARGGARPGAGSRGVDCGVLRRGGAACDEPALARGEPGVPLVGCRASCCRQGRRGVRRARARVGSRAAGRARRFARRRDVAAARSGR